MKAEALLQQALHKDSTANAQRQISSTGKTGKFYLYNLNNYIQISASLPCQKKPRGEGREGRAGKKGNADMKKICDFMVRHYHISFIILTHCTWHLFYIQNSSNFCKFYIFL